MLLEIVTPDRKVFKGEVSSVTLPGKNGSFQILQNHAPIVATLKDGKLEYLANDKKEVVEINGGVVEVKNNKVIVLAD